MLAAGPPAEGYWSALDWPTDRYGHTAVLDPDRDRMIVFGGYDGAGYPDQYYYATIVWILTLSDPPSWTRFRPAGSQPINRYTQSAIYDPPRDRMIVFGGFNSHPMNDLWQLSLTDAPAWSPLVATGAPPASRHRHTSVYDPVRDRMICSRHQRHHAVRGCLGVAAVRLARVERDRAGGRRPTARYRHSAIYDPVRDRMIARRSRRRRRLNDTWALDLGGEPVWSEIQPQAPLPKTRACHCAVYDPAGDRMVYGGEASRATTSGWLSGSPGVVAVTPAGTRPAGHRAIPRSSIRRGTAWSSLAAGPTLRSRRATSPSSHWVRLQPGRTS
jgi:hypothetical protein